MQAQKNAAPAWEQAEQTLEIKPIDPGFDVHDAMRLAGAEDVSEEEQAKAKESAGQRGKRATLLCCCRNRGCGIGPFTEIEEI